MRNRPSIGGAGLVVAIVAVVLALVGGAIALPGKNSVQSNDIKKNAVKSRHLAASALTCPSDMFRLGGLCVDRAPNPDETWLNAAYSCAQQARQLPSHAELLRAAQSSRFPLTPGGEENWASPSDSNGNAKTVTKIAAGNIPTFTRPVANEFLYHCVREAIP